MVLVIFMYCQQTMLWLIQESKRHPVHFFLHRVRGSSNKYITTVTFDIKKEARKFSKQGFRHIGPESISGFSKEEEKGKQGGREKQNREGREVRGEEGKVEMRKGTG